MNETPFTAGNVFSSNAVNLQLFRVCSSYNLPRRPYTEF